jgi:hypothetical protein
MNPGPPVMGSRILIGLRLVAMGCFNQVTRDLVYPWLQYVIFN